ncbi:MAG: hypothetical protein ACI957_003997 [Verrucomicrobiales bacterium]|jgi:hypothetical protein
MSVAEIQKAVSAWSSEELEALERFIRQVRRDRGDGLIYSDDHGDWTDDDQSRLAGIVWDGAED